MSIGELPKEVTAATGSSESDARQAIMAVLDQIAYVATNGKGFEDRL